MSDKNVKVFCRFRPINNQEQKNGGKKMVRIEQNKTVFAQSENKGENNFSFDHVFPEQANQDEVYQKIGKPLIEEIFKGYNATVFAYGQSGSGKTFTMSGYSHLVDNADLLSRDDIVLWNNPKDMGIVPRMVKDIFSTMKNMKDHEFSIQISYVEIYLERIRDLLNPFRENLEIRESRFRGIWIDDVTETYVNSFDEAFKVIRKGELNRTVASTAMNAHSSRSHSVLMITLHQTNLKTSAKTSSRIVCVDLAGSEKVSKTKAEGIVLKQAQATNKSLLTLGLVIRALSEKKPYIPYRDSKLTRLLTDSLGGNSKTHLVITCSPMSYNIEETISTLRFGDIARSILNKPRVNLELNIEEYKRQLLQANETIATQQMIIQALQNDLNQLMAVCEKHKIDVSGFKKEYNFDLRLADESYEESLDKLQKLTEELDVKTSLIGDLQKSITGLRTEIEKAKDTTEHLQDDLLHRKQELDSKTSEFEELRGNHEELTRGYDLLQKQLLEKTEASAGELRRVSAELSLVTAETVTLRQKVAALTEETTTLREQAIRGWKEAGPDNSVEEIARLQMLVEKAGQTEDEMKQLLEGKSRHIQVLEESLKQSGIKLQELVSDHKKKCVEYEKKIKDLESQIRILKQSTPPSNIVVPLKY